MTRALIVWGNWGPYHYARFSALRDAGAQRGVEVLGLQLFSGSGVYDWDSEPRSDERGMHYLDLGHDETRFHPVRLTRDVAPLLRRLRPDVLLVPGFWHWAVCLHATARTLGARSVLLSDTHSGTAKAAGLKKRVKGLITRGFGAALVGGDSHRRYLAELGIAPANVFLGYCVVDGDHFRLAAQAVRSNASEHRARLRLSERYFLSLGRLVPKKDLGTLVRAYALFRKRAIDSAVDLVFVGSGPERESLERLAEEHGLAVIDHESTSVSWTSDGSVPHVHFYGFRQVDETPIFFALATAFVLPSIYEEWGLVINEAMACGLPILASKAAGATEMLVDGDNGVVFSPGDVRALADGLCRIADEPGLAVRMGAESERRVRDWDLDRFAQGALAAIDAAMA